MPDPVQSKGLFAFRTFSGLLIFLFVSASYLYTFPQSNVFYAVVVFLHATAGAIVALLLAGLLFHLLRDGSSGARFGWILLAAGATVALILIKTGTPRAEWGLLYAHIFLSLAGGAIVFAEWAGKRGWLRSAAAIPSFGARSVYCCSLGSAWALVICGSPAGKIRRALRTLRCRLRPWTARAMVRMGHSFPAPPKCLVGRKFPASSSWNPTPANAATRTSTINGSARPIISRHSTISGIAKVL